LDSVAMCHVMSLAWDAMGAGASRCAVRVVLDDGDAVRSGNLGNLPPPDRRQGRGGRVVERRNEVQSPRTLGFAAFAEGVRLEPFRVAGHRHEADSAALRGRAQPGIGERRDAEGVARLQDGGEHGGEHDLGTARHEDALHRECPEPLTEPVGRRRPVGQVPGTVLVLHSGEEAGRSGEPRQTCLQALRQSRRRGLGRHVHAEVDAAGRIRPGHLRGRRPGPPDETAPASRRVDQSHSARLVEGARHRREIDVQLLRQRALRRQARSRREPAGTDVRGQRPDDGEVLGPGLAGDCRAPGFQH
jgi:hypothetical protein